MNQFSSTQAKENLPLADNEKNSDELMHRKLLDAAKEVVELAYCPYSKYPVGVAILTFDDQIYTGCNVENCSFTQTVHAEQVALTKAISEGALKRAINAGLTQLEFIKTIAVYCPKGTDAWPCGNCRQTLNEFGLSMDVIVEGSDNAIICKKLNELIPYAFDMEKLLTSLKNSQ